jgi:hypothetical protein
MSTNGDSHPHSEIHLPSRCRGPAPNWRSPLSRRPARSTPSVPRPIAELLAERDFAARLATHNPTPANRFADQAACDALNEARRKVAAEFGFPYGWRPGKGFRLEDLAGFHNSPRRYHEIRTKPHEMFDHPWFFRWEVGGGPAGLVAQPYAPAFDLAKAEAFAAENELNVHVADLFESWWSPGMCTIVVWERGGPKAGARWSSGPWTKGGIFSSEL